MTRTRFARAKPLLGTTVEIAVAGLAEDDAHAAMDRGFAAVADIHRLMSFHDAASDVSRLNRDAAAGPVAVDARTALVIRRALEVSARSRGLFDITAARHLVAWGFLPPPASPSPPQPEASWRDIAAEPGGIRFRRPLWIDLGGIAKGYAVDQALAAMDLAPDVQAVVNAGGDLRVQGPDAEAVRLRTALDPAALPVVEIADGALASSSGREHLRRFGDADVGPHVDGTSGASVGAARFVSVAAPDCLTADALTKIVLAAGPRAEPILCHFGAIAYVYEAGAGWTTFGAP